MLDELRAGKVATDPAKGFLERIRSAKTEDVRLMEIGKYLDANASKNTVDILQEAPESYTTIRQNELMRKVDLPGFTLYYPDGLKGVATKQVDEIFYREIPASVSEHSRRIIITAQANKQDDYWRNLNPNFGYSNATAGRDKTITIYNGRVLEREKVWHEMGHNFAEGRWGDAGNIGQAFSRASSVDGYISDYARDMASASGLTENFAESMRLYFQMPRYFKETWPNIFDVIDKLVNDPGFPG